MAPWRLLELRRAVDAEGRQLVAFTLAVCVLMAGAVIAALVLGGTP